ncbi:MAG: DNA mismatch repair protein MutL [uncultured archaeon A07HR67]|nr:MAG: DNA mismatch repair protein MutL [uncultured archaeon A07HR67]
MEPPEIERLDERTIQRIAAGEVVERPASAVKELVENSLDAGASRVAVSVEAGGTERIRVRDDGVGIPADQLEAAVAEHATSKIADIDDLEAGVGTLGFRGEALYTIGAVSRLTVRSRPPGAAAGAEVTVEGGDVGEVRPAGCPVGTTVEVDDLFFNTPARKKFLKRVTTEFDHVNTVVTGYALANPDVAVSLEHDGRETFATEGNGDRRSAVLAVYGREVAESMVAVDWTPASTEDAEEPATEGTPVKRVTGLVSHPETTRSGREYLATYVNDRYVTAGPLREAVLAAYGDQLAPDRYPFAVLFVAVPPDEVDVNVHPRKREVRFDREAGVRSAVETAVEAALLDNGLIRSTAPRGRSAPDETDVAPESAGGEVVGGRERTADAPAARRAPAIHLPQSHPTTDRPRTSLATGRPATTRRTMTPGRPSRRRRSIPTTRRPGRSRDSETTRRRTRTRIAVTTLPTQSPASRPGLRRGVGSPIPTDRTPRAQRVPPTGLPTATGSSTASPRWLTLATETPSRPATETASRRPTPSAPTGRRPTPTRIRAEPRRASARSPATRRATSASTTRFPRCACSDRSARRTSSPRRPTGWC